MTGIATVFLLTLLAAMLPGPDFAVVSRNALMSGRRAGIMTAAGIGLALLIHAGYAIAGVGVAVSQSIVLFNVLKWIGAAYLVFIGLSMIRHAKAARGTLVDADAALEPMAPMKALRWGFFTNVTNVKATFFTLSIYTQVATPETPLALQLAFGATTATTAFLWFTVVSLFFARPSVRRAFLALRVWMERIFGVVIAGFGITLAFARQPG
ncbi:LysE family transporter [Notoacmeibacter ruber]|uniref:Lysine transporter LysE n=1 Tax=Notoacmeibacter ruber TaxID=2670375 RepID=A0A3L7JGI5_9HYPH|nr:LysE family transporter [Notoacmeibacter ruber]RLQ88731.1 lysine transporter LysE [Notoacmeibacter ruber]